MKFSGVWLIIIAAVFWGISGGIADILMEKGWDATVISFFRGAVGLIFFSIWFFSRFKQSRGMSVKLVIWSILAGVGVAGNFTFYFLSIENSSMAVAATLMYTAPIFVLLISFIFRIERSTWFKWGCIGSVLIGIIMLTGAYDLGSLSVGVIGASAGLAAGLSYALFIFSFKYASDAGKPQTSLTIAFFTFSIILFLTSDQQQLAKAVTSGDIGWFLLIGVLGGGISFILYVFGIRHTTATTASMVAMVEPVTASLFGVLLLGDALTIPQTAGMVLILATVTFLSKKKDN